jgi:hypothetical protein
MRGCERLHALGHAGELNAQLRHALAYGLEMAAIDRWQLLATA